MTERRGATLEEWRLFSDLFGLTEDLLPVVCNPAAAVSPTSALKALGKVPSVYNARGQVVGMAKWTTLKPTPEDVAGWAANPDYGICIQTRRVRAIDVDIEDPETARAVEVFIRREVGFPMAKRYRDDSSKFLLAFRCERGERIPKRVGRAGEAGIIEFLADGQQFVAAGTHAKGARYKWEWEFPEFPDIRTFQFGD